MEPTEAEQKPIVWEKPSLEQIDKADSLIRHAQLMRTRGETAQVFRLVYDAYTSAPTYSGAIIAYCDELLAGGKVGDAYQLIETAHKGDPADVNIERRFAELVLRTKFHITDFQDLGELESSYAKPWAITVLAVLVPGLGHLVLEKYVRGGILLGCWIVCLTIIFLIPRGLAGLVAIVEAHPKDPLNPLIFIPIAGALVVWVWSLIEATQGAKAKPAFVVEHMKPPVDKPF